MSSGDALMLLCMLHALAKLIPALMAWLAQTALVAVCCLVLLRNFDKGKFRVGSSRLHTFDGIIYFRARV